MAVLCCASYQSQVEIADYLTLSFLRRRKSTFFPILLNLFFPYCNGDWSLFYVWDFSGFLSANSGFCGKSAELLGIFCV